MKKTIKLFSAIIIAGILGLTSCSKDATTTTGDETTITLTDGLTKNEIGSKYGVANVKVSIKLASGTTVKTAKLERKIGTAAAVVILENNRVDTSTDFKTEDTFTDQFDPLTVGDKVVYTVTITDSKSKTATNSLTYTVIRSNAILSSSEIELGAQSNAAIEYKFLGTADNFATYTAGPTGTAKNNSAKIDFVYYYGATQENALAAPSNVDGAQAIWGAEITTWGTKNATAFKTTTITATDFDNIMNVSKVDDTFYSLDFTSGTTDKVVKFTAGSVVAFKTANGVVGLAKFTKAATANDGSMKVQIICQK